MTSRRIKLARPEDPRFGETFFLVEASSFERLRLWDKWNGKVSWIEQTNGYIGQIGTLASRPVVLSVFWSRIEGRLIGFWELTSQVADYAMAERWFKKNCTPPKWDRGIRIARCDAMNFHHCIDAIKEANKSEALIVVP